MIRRAIIHVNYSVNNFNCLYIEETDACVNDKKKVISGKILILIKTAIYFSEVEYQLELRASF